MYADDYVQNDIEHQDPLELIRLLYMKAISKLGEALEHLEEGRIPERSAAVAHASEIVVELQAALDPEKGGEIAESLAALYAYIQLRLAEGNGKQEGAPLAEARELLSTLLEGWTACEPAPSEQPDMVAEEELELSLEEHAVAAEVSQARHAWTL